MPKKTQHNPDNCHKPNEKPEENLQIEINTNLYPSGEINAGMYLDGKWFRVDRSEINEANILCWHYIKNK